MIIYPEHIDHRAIERAARVTYEGNGLFRGPSYEFHLNGPNGETIRQETPGAIEDAAKAFRFIANPGSGIPESMRIKHTTGKTYRIKTNNGADRTMEMTLTEEAYEHIHSQQH